ncbi:hypothetical protein Phum_PHUM137280 [Pediculus humanus corporis]|uniref:OB domain-containing protein n=1 Tax=Pediculus humanus subsp. corporis TaxID=121224 RepID=E0VEP2_PEDHC|nr:uncharacterized protein Phum_PHUM137280 [Pediculus humanus corporis]EEB11848.1 hypothetical protein Phum_PHUM137280 [Pediculus humanus corporis]
MGLIQIYGGVTELITPLLKCRYTLSTTTTITNIKEEKAEIEENGDLKKQSPNLFEQSKNGKENNEKKLGEFKRTKIIDPSYLKITSEELSKCPTLEFINYFSQRSHTCGELNKYLIGKNITLCGWISSNKFPGRAILKDGYGFVEIVPELKLENILVVHGVVSSQKENNPNTKNKNENIEVLVQSLTVVHSTQNNDNSKETINENNNIK